MPRKKEANQEIQKISRNKILMAAFELFALRGYSQTSVESIAVKANVSKGLIYHYFKGKQDILLGLVGLAEAQMGGFFPTAQLPPEDFLEKLIDFSFDFIIQKSKLNRLMLALTVQPEVIRGLKKEMTRLRDEWIGMLVAAFTELKYDHPEEEAYMLLAAFDGMALGHLTFQKEYPLEALRKSMKKRYRL